MRRSKAEVRSRAAFMVVQQSLRKNKLSIIAVVCQK